MVLGKNNNSPHTPENGVPVEVSCAVPETIVIHDVDGNVLIMVDCTEATHIAFSMGKVGGETVCNGHHCAVVNTMGSAG